MSEIITTDEVKTLSNLQCVGIMISYIYNTGKYNEIFDEVHDEIYDRGLFEELKTKLNYIDEVTDKYFKNK